MAQVVANPQPPKMSTVPEDELARALGPQLVAELEVHSDSEDEDWEDFEDEDEEEEEDDEEEDEDDEEEEEEDDEEEEEEEEEEESDSGPEEEEEVYDPYEWHPSEEGFKESDLASRKKRRYLVGQHSFLLLTDPNLKDALDPFKPEDEQITEGERRRRGIKAQKANYKDKCKAAGIKPNAAYLAAIGTKVLDLTNNGLSEKEMVIIIESLEEDKTIERCLLSGNSIGNEGGLALAKMIENNVVIEVLKLANTEILEAFFEICQAACNNVALSELDVSKNELEDDQMVFLGHLLAETASITALYLSYNGITDKGLDNMTRGIRANVTLLLLDLSCNKIKGSQKSGYFFLACGNHPTLTHLTVRNNVVKTSPQVAKVLARNKRLQFMDLSFNIMDEDSGGPFGRSLHGKRQLTHLLFGKQHWHQKSAALALKPFTFPRNFNAETPMQLIDFGWLLDIHTAFIKLRDAAKKINPELEIISGEPYGLLKVPEPDNEALVIRRANTICENFETPLVMLMEELAKEPPEMTTTQFKKFIKQCNLYKDKTQTEAFEKVFEKGPMVVNAAAIIAAFDKEYPGLRKIPDPEPEVEVEEKPKKEKKKKKGKGKKGKGGKGKGKSKTAGAGGAKKAPKKGKGKGKKK